MKTILEVNNLKTYFKTDEGIVKAVDGISFDIKEKETVCIVGESGCGKSVTALSIMRLLPKPAGFIAGGSIIFDETNLLDLSDEQMRSIRGHKISMIFQEPMTSLNPVYTVGEQIMEVLVLHKKLSKRHAKQEAIRMLKVVGIPEAEKRINEYPHQLSGGMRQRVMIAMALACNPKLLIADEPTTALDVTVQAQILDLMNDMKDQFGSAIMFITHDLGVVAEMAQRVVVMYAGLVVEKADVKAIFKDPLHPYTIGLLRSIPRLDENKKRLDIIPGVVPNPLEFPTGCRFHNRCDRATKRCEHENPPLFKTKDGREVRCWLYE